MRYAERSAPVVIIRLEADTRHAYSIDWREAYLDYAKVKGLIAEAPAGSESDAGRAPIDVRKVRNQDRRGSSSSIARRPARGRQMLAILTRSPKADGLGR